MKYLFIAFLFLFTCFNSIAQTTVNDYVILGPQYANQSFYSLANGEVSNVSNTTWDLQLGTAQRSASIRINDAKDIQLFALPNSDTTEWNNIDTTGKYRLYNADTSWEIGAFNNIGSLQHPDYGCLIYSGIGQLKGHRLFMLKLANGSLKKVWVKQLDFYELTILFSDLDNANLKTLVVDKQNYSSKNSFYYNFENDTVLDLEPEALEWDFVTRRYFALDSITFLPFNTVVGVLHNKGIESADIRGVDLSTISSDGGYTYSNYINTIGYDWKSFDYDSSKFDLVDSLGYFVKSLDGNIYLLKFTGFAGSSTGRTDFSVTNLTPSASNISENNVFNNFILYPNPATQQAAIVFSLQENKKVTINVIDISGKNIYAVSVNATQGLNNFTLPVSNFDNGFYFVNISSESSSLTQKLLVAY